MPDVKLSEALDLDHRQLKRPVLEEVTGLPAGVVEGQFWRDGGSGEPQYFDGINPRSMGGGAGFNPRGIYSSGATYNTDDLVDYLGSSWVARHDGITGVTPTSGADWQLVAAKGIDGVDGRTIWYGTTAPGSGVGVDDDFYIRTTTMEWYGPKTLGAWGSPVSLIGPTGPQFPPSAVLTSSGAIPSGRFFIKVDATAGNVTATLPTAVGKDGHVIAVKNISTNTNKVTVDTFGSEKVENLDFVDTVVKGDCVWFSSDNVDWWICSPPTFLAG